MVSFFRKTEGSILPLFGLLLIPLVTMTLMVVDYSRGVRARDTLQRAADAAAIAATTRDPKTSEATRLEKARGIFAANLGDGEFVGVVPKITITKNSAVVEATYQVRLMAPALAGSDTYDVSVISKAGADPRNRTLELAFCIDATGSMQGTLNNVKARALTFAEDLNAAMRARGEADFTRTRIRALFYRDFDVDNPPLKESGFFEMPDEASGLKNFLDPEMASGGGDFPESGNECVDAAIQSKWLNPPDVLP